MRMRHQLALVIFLTSSLGVAALVADRALASREILYGKAEARAQSMAESLGRLMLPHLQRGELQPVSQGAKAFARLPNVLFVQILNEHGQAVFVKSIAEQSGESGPIGRGKDFFQVQTNIDDPDSKKTYGTVQLVVSMKGLKESLAALDKRSAVIGALSTLVLAFVAWGLGIFLGRKLETLVEVAERLEAGEPSSVNDGESDSEIDRLARTLKSLHERLLDEEARRAKLETFKSDITNMLVHDMKHPVTILKAVLALLEDGDFGQRSEGNKSSILRMANRAVTRENAMIEDLLQMAKLNNAEMPLQKERLPLRAFLEDCAKENSLVAAESGRTLNLEIDENLASRWVHGDAASLRRLIGNLVLNAVDHTPPQTQITLGAKLPARSASRVEIFVHDDGLGIPAERREAMFQRYTSFGESARNVGLGLAFCKMVAEKHAGRLDVRSAAGEGSTFTLVLPVSKDGSIQVPVEDTREAA